MQAFQEQSENGVESAEMGKMVSVGGTPRGVPGPAREAVHPAESWAGGRGLGPLLSFFPLFFFFN